ncbi:MAG: MBL fold metallo-hydrolase [Clostridia bacterium]|nr:MBL fold metallo-hydrolase [Clostridia bacterium]
MKKTKKLISLLLAVVLSVGLFAACTNDPGSGSTTTNGETTDVGQELVADVQIATDKKVHFKIIYPTDTADDVKESIFSLYEALVTRSNNGIVLISEANSDSYSADAAEILIGDTGYPESKTVMNNIGYGDWTVRFEGKKLVVTGYSRDALRKAITQTIQTVKNASDGQGNITVAGDLCLSGTNDAMINNLPRYESAAATLPVTADEGQNASLAVMKQSTAAEYDAYLGKLATQGYTLYTSNVIEENRFATYTNDKYLISAGWYPYENSARITIEAKGSLVGLESDNVWTPVNGITTSLAQLGLGTEANDYPYIGMSYVYQLADGSFIVIDGGFASDGERIYNYMKAKAPNGEIVIAAWFITHNDPDHYRAFVNFVGAYRDMVKVEYVVKNMPNSFAYMESGSDENSATHSLAATLPNCKVIKAHTGQKFYIRNAVVEILYTIDNYLPLSLDNFNNSSMVFTVDTEGERALFTGDISDYPASILLPMYGEYLKCDILQLAHHGVRNGHGLNMPNMIELYKAMRPEVVLWPSSEAHYLNADNMDESEQIALFSWNLEGMKSARETWIAGGDVITVFELPYSHFSAYRFDPSNPHPTPVAKNVASDSDSLNYHEVVGDAYIEHVGWADGK